MFHKLMPQPVPVLKTNFNSSQDPGAKCNQDDVDFEKFKLFVLSSIDHVYEKLLKKDVVDALNEARIIRYSLVYCNKDHVEEALKKILGEKDDDLIKMIMYYILATIYADGVENKIIDLNNDLPDKDHSFIKSFVDGLLKDLVTNEKKSLFIESLISVNFLITFVSSNFLIIQKTVQRQATF
ncbi:uncharacterized protein LOC144425867 isoform X2 [Styela clava]